MNNSYLPPPEPIFPPPPPRRRARSTAPPRQGAHWLLWLTFVVLVALAISLLTPTLLGIYVGSQERTDYLRAQAEEHYKQALTYESENNMAQAQAELQIALQLDPTYQPATDKLHTLQTPPATPNHTEIAAELFRRAQDALAQQQWNDAIDALEQIRRDAPDYQTSEIQTLLAQAYLNAGQQSVTAGQIQQAQARFEAAYALDSANAEVQTMRDRAALYLNGAQAIDTSWPKAVTAFQKLYQQDPNFYDVKNQLWNALVQYGDMAVQQGSPCIAVREYEQAIKLDAQTEVTTKLAQANVSCQKVVTAPTATPSAAIFRGTSRVDETLACQGEGSVRGQVRDAQGNPLAGAQIQIYNDVDYRPAPVTTDAQGQYQILLGGDAGLFHLVVLDADGGARASAVFDLNYPGGNVNGCHWIVDWTKSE